MKSTWAALGSFLSRPLVLLPPDHCQRARGEWEEISQEEHRLDDRLAVGLVGGTGVGKSTLINALAGKTISKTGDRRPTTDRVVAYRHQQTPLPPNLPVDAIAEPEVVHATFALERVVLLDFPDFDSVEELHHEILQRYSPYLDVLIVLVDDVKYADSRLFELLRHVRQSHDNLHVVLNKVDHLDDRYPGRWRSVADDILVDLRAKLAKHADMNLAPETFLALSARNAFVERSADASSATAGEVGDFPRLLELLDTYRQEKLRRAAKVLNIEARKVALCAQLRDAALAPRESASVARASEQLQARRGELERTLAGIAEGIFSREERRRIVSGSLMRGTARFGFPVDVFITLVSQLRVRRGAPRTKLVQLSGARVGQHYRSYREAVSNALQEIRLNLDGVLGLEFALRGGSRHSLTRTEDAFEGAGEELQVGITAAEGIVAKRSILWNHALPALVVGLFLWSIVYPPLSTVLQGLEDEGEAGVQWGAVLRKLVFSVLDSLDPLVIVSLLLAVVVAYVMAAVTAWTRQVGRLDQAITEAENSFRQRVKERGNTCMDQAAESIARWTAEREELTRLAGASVAASRQELR